MRSVSRDGADRLNKGKELVNVVRYRERLKSARRAFLIQDLIEVRGNVSELARQLQLSRTTIDRWMQDLDIDVNQLKQNWESADIMAELSAEQKAKQDKINQYANSYCIGVVPGGGITGTHRCNVSIPITETYCEDCKKRMEAK